MVIQPKVRGFICTSAHPEGCFKSVESQVKYVKSHGRIDGAKNVLIIGASTGYGLASRIVSTFACGAKTIGVFFEKSASGKRTASAGWYNTAAFEKLAHEEGLYAKSINGDAFSDDIKQQTIDLITKDIGKIDLVIYSLASPRRTHPKSGETFNSVLKPMSNTYVNKTVDPIRGEVKEISIEPANEAEVAATVTVMGGEDWEFWMDALNENNLLADNFKTLAYSYIGPELTHDIYTNGTIGAAKQHLQETADRLNERYADRGGMAAISVNKALVTQASSAIPVVPLYMSILFKYMKEKGTHEGCIEQMYRLFKDFIYADETPFDDQGRIRIDELEMQDDIQQKVTELWPQINTENLESLTDIVGYRDDFYKLFGFNIDGIDYDADVNVDVKIDSID